MRQLFDIGSVKLLIGAAIGEGALWDIKAQMTGRQRLGLFEHQVVEFIAIFAADLDRIAKALGGQQRGLRPFALDHRIGHQRRAVDQVLHLSRRDPKCLQRCRQRLFHG